jgi:hypothetical protein
MAKKQSLGIDLGTSNCSITLTQENKTEVLDIFQIAGANRTDKKPYFASCLYIPYKNQFPKDSIKLPWTQEEQNFIVGNFAREIGSQMSDRLITSVKSWLCNQSIDPSKPILPWRSDTIQNKLSPLDVTCLYLKHLKAAFETVCSERAISSEINETQVVLTVPASFDEVARNFTARAAVDAGWGTEVVLLEEPQAAFYSWLGSHSSDWRKQVRAGEIILICDIGGGTTDFSLIAVVDNDGNLELERISVGRHILLGGDNMDLALAYSLSQQLKSRGTSIDNWQFIGLIHACRKAKEKLFENGELDNLVISVPSRSSNLFSQTITTTLSRQLLDNIILEGFFALTPIGEKPVEQKSVGLQELGLSYETDAVISKHLASFLTNSLKNVLSSGSLSERVNKFGDKLTSEFLQPDAILFNGGVFCAKPLRQRVVDLLCSWSPEKTVRVLEGFDLNTSVSKGASLYGNNKINGKGIRIRSGISRSYYIGIETPMMAIPGFSPPVKALCVAEQRMEEGEERILEDREFGLLTGTKVTFRFFSSSDRAGDKVGYLVDDAEKKLEETAELEMTLHEVEGYGEKTTVPVKLHSSLNELGTLQLWMQHTKSEKRWKLNFSVRIE